MWKKKTIGKKKPIGKKSKHVHIKRVKRVSSPKFGVKRKAEWGSGRHWCGHGFRGWIVKSHGLTFCNLCGKERSI